jgi:hypothetical protein
MGAAAATLIPLVVGTAAQYFGQRQYNKRIDQNLAAGIRKRGEHARNAAGKVNMLVDQTAASNPDAERANMLAGYQKQLLAHRGESHGALNPLAGASDQYGADLLKAALGIQTAGNRQADIVSRIDSPIAQRRGEARSRANVASELDLISDEARSDDYLNELRRASIRPSPWLAAIAQIAKGYSKGGGAGIASLFGGSTDLPSLGDFGEG